MLDRCAMTGRVDALNVDGRVPGVVNVGKRSLLSHRLKLPVSILNTGNQRPHIMALRPSNSYSTITMAPMDRLAAVEEQCLGCSNLKIGAKSYLQGNRNSVIDGKRRRLKCRRPARKRDRAVKAECD